jgi:hypothetical protein
MHDLFVLTIMFEMLSFFYIIICNFYVAFLMLSDIEAPPSREQYSIRKPDPNFLLVLC